MAKLQYKRLEPKDMDQWFKIRIESLHDSPSAFLASPETEEAQGVEFFREKILNGGNEKIILGCFDELEIVGSVGLYQDGALKARHKGTILGNVC